MKVYTAYEYLEGRFNKKTRVLTAILFLIQRGLSAGITIFAPAIILSAVLGWNLITLNIIIGVLVIIYTVSGGTKAVSVTQKQQMVVIFGGMVVAFYLILEYLPKDITFIKALEIAGASNKMKVLDFSWDLNNRYTVWSGILGGTFLMLSYFGTDQSQVQRYLYGKSLRESQLGLIFNGLLKVTMQFFILLLGVMVFVFYQFNPSPLNFNPKTKEVVKNSKFLNKYEDLEKKHKSIEQKRNQIILLGLNDINKTKLQNLNESDKRIKEEAKTIISNVDSKIETNDKDYIFILNNLPKGLIGLLLAVILSAAMSSTASELNALASTTTMDLYKRNVSKSHSQKHYVIIAKWFTLGWGLLAILVACVANLFDNLIQLVNIIGSIFYGNVLGIFLLAFFFKFVKGNSVFIGGIITQIMIIFIYYFGIFQLERLGKDPIISYLWLNVLGAVIVILISLLFQLLSIKKVKKNII